MFFRSPGGLEATKGPHSAARVSAAHHAAGAAARALRDKTDTDRRHERQRATSMRTHVRRCVPPRGRPTTDDGRRRPNVHTRMQATHHHTTPTASRRGGALHHGKIDDHRRYERQQAPNTRNDSIDRAYPRREEAPLQPAASMASSRERPPHLTSAASATRHATKIGTPADETSDEGERRVTSVRPLASNTARVTVLRGGMRARRHNKGRERVSARNPKHHHTASERTPPLPHRHCPSHQWSRNVPWDGEGRRRGKVRSRQS